MYGFMCGPCAQDWVRQRLVCGPGGRKPISRKKNKRRKIGETKVSGKEGWKGKGHRRRQGQRQIESRHIETHNGKKRVHAVSLRTCASLRVHVCDNHARDLRTEVRRSRSEGN